MSEVRWPALGPRPDGQMSRSRMANVPWSPVGASSPIGGSDRHGRASSQIPRSIHTAAGPFLRHLTSDPRVKARRGPRAGYPTSVLHDSLLKAEARTSLRSVL